jgi:hypothetical protein
MNNLLAFLAAWREKKEMFSPVAKNANRMNLA